MRWKPLTDRTLPDWLGYPILVLTAPVWGVLIATLWFDDVKARFMGPSAQWRPWFAWHPVFSYDEDKSIWLEWVQRRTHWNMTEYRLPPANGQSTEVK